jgi:2-polyprenyl-6-hydroxyphenyl methylase/3-demethylubiquinone-9 3-methyltransferase
MKSKQITESSINDLIFDANSGEWWIEDGAFKALHSFNLIRTKFLTDAINSYFNKTLKGQKILDVGCGGGIFCEPLARLGANVTGIDTNKKAIQSAYNHAKSQNLKINYLNTNLEGLNNEVKFDVITCMEVLEHVDDISKIFQGIKKKLKKNGLFVGSTINKTPTSYITAIFLAENVLNLVPKGTHEWKKFIKPSYLKKNLIIEDFSHIRFSGLFYNPLFNNWKFINSQNVNYIFSAKLK